MDLIEMLRGKKIITMLIENRPGKPDPRLTVEWGPDRKVLDYPVEQVYTRHWTRARAMTSFRVVIGE